VTARQERGKITLMIKRIFFIGIIIVLAVFFLKKDASPAPERILTAPDETVVENQNLRNLSLTPGETVASPLTIE